MCVNVQHRQTFRLSNGSGCCWHPSPFAECCLQSLRSLWRDAHLCKLCRPKFKCSPYLQLWSHSLFFVVVFVFYSGLNNCFSGQNLIPVLQQWTIMTWRCFGFDCCFFSGVFFFLLFWSKPDLLRIEIFPWGSQRKNPILLMIPWRMIATFTFYCSAPQHKNIWNLFNHISSHTKAIKSTLQIIYDSTQCNIIHNTILIISEKNGIPQPIRFSWPACNKDWISFHPALVSVRMN